MNSESASDVRELSEKEEEDGGGVKKYTKFTRSHR